MRSHAVCARCTPFAAPHAATHARLWGRPRSPSTPASEPAPRRSARMATHRRRPYPAARQCSRALRAHDADVAQLVEQLIRNQQVRGSSPRVGTIQSSTEPDRGPAARLTGSLSEAAAGPPARTCCFVPSLHPLKELSLRQTRNDSLGELRQGDRTPLLVARGHAGSSEARHPSLRHRSTEARGNRGGGSRGPLRRGGTRS